MTNKVRGFGVPLVATQAEQEAASNLTHPVTPGRQQYHPSAAKAWILFNGTGTPASSASYNISSVTDNGTGDYTLTFATPFSSANYCCVTNNKLGGAAAIAGDNTDYTTATASAYRLYVVDIANSLVDIARIHAAFFGDQ